MACADVATAIAKITAIHLIFVPPCDPSGLISWKALVMI
jgi:hypothetical protein